MTARSTRHNIYVWICLFLWAVAGCNQAENLPPATTSTRPVTDQPAATPTPFPVVARPDTTDTFTPLPPVATETATNRPVSPTPTLPPSHTPTATPDPYAELTIEALAARSYGGGELDIIDTLEETETYTRYLITYPSDGLTIYGFLSVPVEGDKFPVAIVAHGYIPPDEYVTEAYTTRYATALTEAGFLVIHPNFRNYPPSDEGLNPFRIGYTVDLLNLMAIVQEQSQDPFGYLRRADGENIHLMGHSMGGGVVLRAIVVRPEMAKAAVLYGSMSGDEVKNYQRILEWSGGTNGHFEAGASPEMMQAIAPIYHLDRIQAPVSIHHSLDDDVVPPEWSDELCQLLQELEHPVECFTYENTPHTFLGFADTQFIERMITFFQRN